LRDIGSVQPLAPTSRRASQQQRDVNGGHTSPHPYATPPNGYRTANTNAFGRHSPNPVPHQLLNGGSESFLYGQPAGKNGADSREETTIADPGVHVRGFNREQMQRVGEGDEDGGHGRKGFWSNLCC
jgi:casein kinase 1